MSADTQAARMNMVDSQVRPNKVTDPRIVAAMRALPREDFLPQALAARAYADEDVALGAGRVMPEPMVIARMLQMATLRRGESVLVVAAGTGYGAALAAACGTRVTAVEDDPALLAIARGALAAHAPDVALVDAPPVGGWAASGPYDCILVEGAVEALPAAITGQLGSAGRLVMVRTHGARMGQAVIGRVTGQGLSFVAEFDCAVPPLPAMRKIPAFVF